MRARAARHLPYTGIVDEPLAQGRLRLDAANGEWVANRVFWYGWSAFQPSMTPVFLEFARHSSTAIDIGAHVGFYSILAARANPSSRIMAVEPMPPVASRLRRNLALNGLHDVLVEEVAADDRTGASELHFVRTDSGLTSSQSLSSTFMSAAHADLQTVAISTMLGDDLVQMHHLEPDVVKIDVESLEDRVLLGLRDTIAQHRPAVFCELLPGPDIERTIEALLEPMGYQFFGLSPQGPERQQRLRAHHARTDWLFLARDEHLSRLAARST